MLAAARASGRQLSVIAQNRFQTPVARLKRVLQSGLAGKILHAQADSFWWRGDRYYDLWWRGTWEKEGGGCTMNHAVHHVDLYLWLMGMPTAVQSVTANLAHDNSEVEDFSTTVLFHPEGSVGQLTASLVHHGESQQLVFQGEHAQVAVPWQVRASRQKENGFPERDAERERKIQAFYEGLPALAVEGHNAQIANFIAAIRGLEPLAVDGAAGRRTVELITAIYQSGQSGVRVSLPLEASSPFYSRDRLLRQVRHFHEKTKNVANFSTDEITLGRNLGR